MKKLLSILLSAVLVGTTLFGCTSKPSDSTTESAKTESVKASTTENTAPTEISFCYWGGASEANARKELVKLYNQSQSNIIVKEIPIDNASYVAKMQAFFAAGNAPDVVQSSADYGDVYMTKGLLEELTPYIEQDNLRSHWPEVLLNQYTYDDKIYATPMTINTMNIAINKDMFDKAGVPYPSKDWTEDEFLAAAKKLTNGEGANKVYGFLQGWSTPTLLANMYGTYIFDTKNMKLNAANNQSFVDAFTYLANLVQVEGVSPDAAGEKAAGGGLASGKFAMEISALWGMDDYQKSIGDSFQFDIVRFPINAEYGRWRTPISNIGFYMSSKSDKKDAAWEFMKFGCTNDEAQYAMERCSIPASKSVLEDPKYLDHFPEGWNFPFDKSVSTDLSTAVDWPLTAGVWAKVMDELTTQWDLVMNQKVTVDKAITDFQKSGDDILAKEAKK